MRRRFKVLLGILLVVLVVLVGFVVWAEPPPSPMPEAFDALKNYLFIDRSDYGSNRQTKKLQTKRFTPIDFSECAIKSLHILFKV